MWGSLGSFSLCLSLRDLCFHLHDAQHLSDLWTNICHLSRVLDPPLPLPGSTTFFPKDALISPFPLTLESPSFSCYHNCHPAQPPWSLPRICRSLLFCVSSVLLAPHTYPRAEPGVFSGVKSYCNTPLLKSCSSLPSPSVKSQRNNHAYLTSHVPSALLGACFPLLQALTFSFAACFPQGLLHTWRDR